MSFHRAIRTLHGPTEEISEPSGARSRRSEANSRPPRTSSDRGKRDPGEPETVPGLSKGATDGPEWIPVDPKRTPGERKWIPDLRERYTSVGRCLRAFRRALPAPRSSLRTGRISLPSEQQPLRFHRNRFRRLGRRRRDSMHEIPGSPHRIRSRKRQVPGTSKPLLRPGEEYPLAELRPTPAPALRATGRSTIAQPTSRALRGYGSPQPGRPPDG